MSEELETNRVIEGDCFEVLDELPPESVHSVITDSPYGLAFMGRSWDDFEPKEYQEWCEEWATKALRVLKPGGHLLAFSGNRTHHRLFTGIEDAGFVVRDTLTWHYGSGFPKGQDVGKLIDKQRDDEEEIRTVCRWLRSQIEESDWTVAEIADEFGYHSRMVDHWAARNTDSQPAIPKSDQWRQLKRLLQFGDEMDDLVSWLNDRKGEPADAWGEREVLETLEDHKAATGHIYGEYANDGNEITAPATDEAEQWDGWSTQLKPSTEFVVMARKPLSEDTIAENVLEHGTAALNIDECRIESDGSHKRQYQPTNNDRNVYGEQDGFEPTNADGRYPANILLDDVTAAQLDEQSGSSVSSGGQTVRGYGSAKKYGNGEDVRTDDDPGYGDVGGASRFFYCSKATKAERTLDGKIDNGHPTVKPIDLMEWLVKLVTAEGQIVLDPFCGSGTTLRAAKNLGREFIGIEKQAKWCDVARARCGLTPENPEVLTDENQSALNAYTSG